MCTPNLPHDHGDSNESHSPNDAPALVSRPAAEKFLAVFFKSALKVVKKGARIAIFCLPGRQTFASRKLSEVTDAAIEMAQDGQNVYFHLHLHDLPYAEGHQRGEIETVTAAVALAVDIDAVGRAGQNPVTCCARKWRMPSTWWTSSTYSSRP